MQWVLKHKKLYEPDVTSVTFCNVLGVVGVTFEMSANHKYEKIYQEDPAACGETFGEIIDFFESLDQSNLRVLDLGCGQGRDALFIARLGHSVTVVDISPTGIEQMLKVASDEELQVQGIVGDLTQYEIEDTYDVVILDRVLHMIPDKAVRLELLERAAASVDANGFLLIADVLSNLPEFAAYFEKDIEWSVVFQQRGFLFAQF